VVVATGLSESLTWTVKLLVPVWVGLPEIAPVVACREKLVGRDPETIVQL
jgi:hypothetical protein